MKRFLAITLAAMLSIVAATELCAQKYGVLGGATFSNLRDIENSQKTGWNAGATVQFRLPLGFSIQPSLMYNHKAAQVVVQDVKQDVNVGSLELPVSVQWGPDLLIFRPFLDVSPFIGYALDSSFKGDRLNRFTYGVGLGGGLEIWRIQILCRYSWSMGPLFKTDGLAEISPAVKDLTKHNYNGVTLSVAFLFGE